MLNVSWMQRQNSDSEGHTWRDKVPHTVHIKQAWSHTPFNKIFLQISLLSVFYTFPLMLSREITPPEVVISLVLSVSRFSSWLWRNWHCQLMFKWHVYRVALISNNFTFYKLSATDSWSIRAIWGRAFSGCEIAAAFKIDSWTKKDLMILMQQII